MSKTITDVASQIADAVMDAIERRNGIIKDDITEAARGVLAKNQSGSSPYNPYIGMFPPPPTPDVYNGTAWVPQAPSPATVAGCLAPGGTVLTVDHVRRAFAHFKDMDAAYEAARNDLIAYGNSVVRVNGDGSVEHVKPSDWNDDGSIWSLPNGSP